MKANDKFEHPEILDMMHICAVSPDVEGTREICDLMGSTTIIDKSKSIPIKRKNNDDLDKSLEDTFPASDPISHY
jgi:hypothetical protein